MEAYKGSIEGLKAFYATIVQKAAVLKGAIDGINQTLQQKGLYDIVFGSGF